MGRIVVTPLAPGKTKNSITYSYCEYVVGKLFLATLFLGASVPGLGRTRPANTVGFGEQGTDMLDQSFCGVA